MNVQGFGAVGYNAAKFFVQSGGILTGIQLKNGYIYNPKGYNCEEIRGFIEQNNGIETHKDYVAG